MDYNSAPYNVVPPFAPPVEDDAAGAATKTTEASTTGMLLLTTIQQTIIANIAGWVCLITGLLGIFWPYKAIEWSSSSTAAAKTTKQHQEHDGHLKLYFLDEHDKAHHDALPVLAYNVQYQSLPVLENGLVWILMSYLQIEFLDANCLASIPWILFAIWSLYHEVPKKLGRSNKAAWTLLLLNIPRLISLGLVRQDQQEDNETARRFAVQMNIIFALMNGLVFCVSPSKVQSVYGLPTEEHHRVLLARQVFGNNLFALGVFGASKLWFETTNVMAFGLSWSASLIGVIWLTTTTTMATNNNNEGTKLTGSSGNTTNTKQIYAWIVIMVFFAYTLTYQPQHLLEEEVETVAVVTIPWWKMVYDLLTGYAH